MLYRARIAFVVAVVLGAILLATEFPLAGLVHARATANATAAELSRIQTENRTLSNQVHDLRQGSTIQQIAHQEYGLVEQGQRSVVIMPGGGNTGSVRGHGTSGPSAPLGSTTIPKSDIVPTDSSLSTGVGGGGSGAGSGGGFWQRLLNRLEFWKGSV